jgi:hypothetical protein
MTAALLLNRFTGIFSAELEPGLPITSKLR